MPVWPRAANVGSKLSSASTTGSDENLAPRDVLEARVRPSDVKRVPDDFEISGLAVENLDPERDRPL